MSALLYRPELREKAGSVTAAILLSQLMYWWEKSGSRPFYKFKEPCQHPAYKAGDSWREELAFTRPEFDTALRKLIDNGLVSKKVTRDRLTIYTVTDAALALNKKSAHLHNNPNTSQSRKPAFDIQKTKAVDYQETTNNTPTPEPDLPEVLQAQDKIVVCDKSILQSEKIEKPEAVSDEAYQQLMPALKTLKVKQAVQVLELLAMAAKEGSIKTTQQRLGGAYIKAARNGELDTSRLEQAEKPVQTHPSQIYWRAKKASPENAVDDASRAAGLAAMEALLKSMG